LAATQATTSEALKPIGQRCCSTLGLAAVCIRSRPIAVAIIGFLGAAGVVEDRARVIAAAEDADQLRTSARLPVFTETGEPIFVRSHFWPGAGTSGHRRLWQCNNANEERRPCAWKRVTGTAFYPLSIIPVSFLVLFDSYSEKISFKYILVIIMSERKGGSDQAFCTNGAF
jgi:hypothetical protein